MKDCQTTYHFEMPMQVRDYEVDSQGIVNNAVYLHYLEHTRHQFCAQAGTSFRAMQEHGIDPVIREISIRYLRPLTLGEEMISKLKLHRQGARFVFQQDIFNIEGQSVVEALCTIVCLENGRLTRGDILADAFSNYL